MHVVPDGPPRHRALFDPVLEAARLRFDEQRHEALLEVDQVLVHRELLVAPHEPADRRCFQGDRCVEHAEHEVVLLRADRPIVVEEVVEIAEVGDPDAATLDRGLDALRAARVEGSAQVQRICDRVQHRLRGHVALVRVQGARELDALDLELAREVEPLFDGEVGDRGRAARGA